jgi:hypothetical protein
MKTFPAPLAMLVFAAALSASKAYAGKTEIKFVVQEEKIEESYKSLKAAKTIDAKIETMDVYFLETADLGLSGKDLILRLRSVAGENDEATVKLRGPEAISAPARGFPVSKEKDMKSKIEHDWVIGGVKGPSFSITRDLPAKSVSEALGTKIDIKLLFSPLQQKFLASYSGGVAWEKLRLLGPVGVAKFELPGAITVEHWTLPKSCGGKQVLEVSTKVDEDQDAAATEAALIKQMADLKIPREEHPESKTRSVLECLMKAPR